MHPLSPESFPQNRLSKNWSIWSSAVIWSETVIVRAKPFLEFLQITSDREAPQVALTYSK